MSHSRKVQALLLGTILTAALPAISFAASVGANVNVQNPGLKFPVKRSVTYAAPLADITDSDRAIKARVLDWRKPVMELSFDLSEADHTDKLELLLTADPMGKVSPNTPIMVQLNNDAPRRINTRGQGFDARITLNASKARARRNTIRLTYETPRGAECVLPQHGAWLVDLKHSKLVVSGRAKSRALQLREVEMRLDLPAIAPRRVGVVAKGGTATTLQALAAQGVGLRMDSLPSFTTARGVGDFEIIMARRDQLSQYTDDPKLLNGSGPRLYVPKGRPMRLIITADTDKQLLETAKSFATYKLPDARRQITSLGEMHMQSRLDKGLVRVSGTQKLADIPGTHFVSGWDSEDWASGPQAMRFSVADPAAMSGEVVLKLSASDDVAEDSRLRVALNGELLGSAKLDKTRKTAAFNIRAGSLRGVDNILTLTPELNAKDKTTCAAHEADTPNFFLGNGSKIVLNQDIVSPITELSRMAASAAPFSDNDGAGSYFALPKSATDFNASLSILAQLAKVNGQGLIDADYARAGSLNDIGDRHALIIGPAGQIDKDIRKMAPSAFSSALRGQAISGDNLLSASYGEFASNDHLLIQQFAANYAKTGRIKSGGVATLFGSPKANGKVIGVITNTPGQSFKAAANFLVQPNHWNEMEGGVARWNSRSMLLAQTASPVTGYALPSLPKAGGAWDKIASFEMPDFNLPDADGLKNWGANAGANIKSGLQGLLAKLGAKDAPAVQSAAITAPEAKPRSFAETIIQPQTAQRPETAQSVDFGQAPALRGPINLDTQPKWEAGEFKTNAASKLDGIKTWLSHAKTNTANWVSDFDLGEKIDRFQDNLRPIGSEIKQSIKTKDNPVMKAVKWGDRNMSLPAFLLIFALGFVFLLMAISAPASRLGGRH